ncbi:MAG: HDOD domain-containing protein [Myxococcota bacterium]|nr:HDOD domain-containing protein [Myxococcota bacterium]
MLQARVRPSVEHQQNNFYRMLRVIQEARRLPSPPAIVARLTELLADPEYKSKELVSVVAMDPAIAAEVLNLANSAYFKRAAGPTGSVQKSIETIGDRQLMQLLVARAALGLRSRILTGYTLQEVSLWHRSLTVAVAAGVLARRTQHTAWSHAYTVGLLMDIGLLAMGEFIQEHITAKTVSAEAFNLDDFEVHWLGIDHAELGRRLARTWGLPPVVWQGIGYHHRPGDAGEYSNLAYVVHGADAITNEMVGPLSAGPVTAAVDPRWMQVVGIDDEEIESIKLSVEREVTAALRSLGATAT